MQQAPDLPPLASRTIAVHAAIAGLCPLIPLPFLDDMAIRRISRRMFTDLFEAHGLTLSKAGARILGSSPPGWARGTASSFALLPFRKLLRKLAVVLAIKDCADVASATYHDGWLLELLLAEEAATRRRTLEDPKFLRRVRKATLATYADVDPAPLRRALLGSFRGVKVGAVHAAQAVKRLLRGGADVEADEVEDLATRLRAATAAEWQYFERLEHSFRRHLGLPERPARPSDESRQGA